MRKPLISRLFPLLFAGLLLVGCQARPYKPGPPLNASAFMQVVETLTAPEMQGRDAGSGGIGLARDFIVGRFKSLGLEPAFMIDGEPSFTQPLAVRTGKNAEGKVIEAPVQNVGALLPGSGNLKDQVVVIGGHYDHIGYGHYGSRAKEHKGELHPGADDNASGTAGVLLLARHFALQHHNDGKPRRTLFFTGFAAEERGLIGSRYMVRNPGQWAFDAKQVSGMINLDMIGRLRGDDLYIFTDATGEQWRGWTEEANEDVGLNLKWDVRAPGGSDHSMFISIGVPAVFFNTWLHDDYHTPRDTADKINGEGGTAVLQVVAGLAERAVTEPERITFVPPKPRPPRPYLGVMLGDAEAGVLMQDLLADGPLDEAGAKNGDVLLSIGGKPMSSPGDVRAFLAKAKAGTEVKVQVKRGDETLDLTVLLGVRR
ncbi:MAG: M28 family peptidase [Phycisphaeraceae bacterium]|nr:M28 family peptidase [Phycisphaeraceae bacterium]